MFGLFQKSNVNKSLTYDSGLIKKFHKEHVNLVAHIGDIQNACSQSNPKKAKKHLQNFKMELLGHFMEEDIKLYWYLRDYYKDNQHASELIKSFENSIKEIQRDVMKFLDHYSREDVTLDAKFKSQFSDIIDTLSSRISSEETNLYSLYVK